MTDENNVPLVKRWLVAARPFSFTASVTAILLGAAIAYHAGASMKWGLFALTLAGILCFQTAANFLNDVFDHRRGLDTESFPTSGAVVRGWLTEKQVFIAAFIFIALGVLCGLLLVRAAGNVVLILGLIGVGIVLFYTTAGICFKYMGLGDLAVFVAFAILPVFGTYWVQVQEFSWKPILWSIPLGFYTVAILHANNWRDIESDKAKGCTTMASLFGDSISKDYYRALVIGPFVLVCLYLAIGIFTGNRAYAPLMVLLVWLSLPAALKLAVTKAEGRGKSFLMLDGRTAQTQLVFGVLLSLSFVLSRFFNVN